VCYSGLVFRGGCAQGKQVHAVSSWCRGDVHGLCVAGWMVTLPMRLPGNKYLDMYRGRCSGKVVYMGHGMCASAWWSQVTSDLSDILIGHNTVSGVIWAHGRCVNGVRSVITAAHQDAAAGRQARLV
jgi:hypothetical protein